MHSTAATRQRTPTPSSSKTSAYACCSQRPATAMRCSSPMRVKPLPINTSATTSDNPRRSAHRACAHAGGRRLRQRAHIRGRRLRPAPTGCGARGRGSGQAGRAAYHLRREHLHERGRFDRCVSHPATERDAQLRTGRAGAGRRRATYWLRSAAYRHRPRPPRLSYEETFAEGALQKRLIEHVRTQYRPDDLGTAQADPLALLPPGQLESLALPGESLQACLYARTDRAAFRCPGQRRHAGVRRPVRAQPG